MSRGWRPIKSYRHKPYSFRLVDIWMAWGASPLTMGIADAFRVPDAYYQNGKWFHDQQGQKRELNKEYITHWMAIPKGPK